MSVKAFIFDWAGTMVDHGCCAPVLALQKVFADEGVAITDEEARADMGKAKDAHIRAILAKPRVEEHWKAVKGARADDADVARLFNAVGPLMQAAAAQCSALIPGAVELVETLRARGVKIGSSTGYTRDMMRDILPLAQNQGYAPDFTVCAGETSEGRPAPFMIWKNLIELGVWPTSSCVKVDDAPVGIVAGRNAGCWTIGVAASGNEIGLSLEAYTKLDQSEREMRLQNARRSLSAAGAHYVVDSVADIPALLDEIDQRIGAGERPAPL